MKLELLHSLALTAAKRAGAYVQSMVNRCEDVRVKEAGDTPASQVVTEVDLESQRLILETLHESIEEFQLGLLTEESADDSSRFEKDCFWCIDPLDGTLPFINGSPGYSISIALVTREGKSQIGVIHDPGTEQTFHAVSGRGAFLNDVGIHSQYDTKSERLTWLMDSSMKGSAGYSRLLAAIEDLATRENLNLNIIAHAGAALNGSWVTQHAPAIYFKVPKPAKGGGSLWDFAATACVLEEWGTPASDVFGRPLDLNRAGSTFMNERGVIYASDNELREAVQQIYRQYVG